MNSTLSLQFQWTASATQGPVMMSAG